MQARIFASVLTLAGCGGEHSAKAWRCAMQVVWTGEEMKVDVDVT